MRACREFIIFNNKKYYKQPNGYYRHKTQSYRKELHVAIYENHYNIQIPKSYIIHHKDLNNENNNIENLQFMSRSEHTKLHKSLEFGEKHKNNTSGFVGVIKKGNKYAAYFKKIYLGIFNTAEEASCVYQKVLQECRG